MPKRAKVLQFRAPKEELVYSPLFPEGVNLVRMTNDELMHDYHRYLQAGGKSTEGRNAMAALMKARKKAKAKKG